MSDIFEHIRSLAERVEAENENDASDLRYYSEQIESSLREADIAPAMYDVRKYAEKILEIAEKHRS
ncbi:hypothetical protein ASD97_26120 [Streptomyces sp. Root63]|uniref:hypothetical protein n=1 Tax=unclassified Streptomyces TaxID=2593676 RepID=UPI0006F22113|nr:MULTISPECIES: hypothetical protein [unclassified Streptomyces]KQX43547.1 hypothetical protein ASD29_32420 [Streptomyces sp. Root1295]KRA34111.1 hypothetical protein ASD97_26120 [Streptomyces sp. Root63]